MPFRPRPGVVRAGSRVRNRGRHFGDVGPRTLALGAFARGPSPFCHLLPECSGFRQKRPPGAFPRLSGGKLSTDTKTAPQDAVGVEAVDRNRPRHGWRPPALLDGGLGGDCLSVGDYVTGAVRATAARGTFEVPVEDSFLSSSCAVETSRQGGPALQLLRTATSEKARVDAPCAPYGAFRRPSSVGQVDGPALLQHLPDDLAGLPFFHGQAVPDEVFRRTVAMSIQFSA